VYKSLDPFGLTFTGGLVPEVGVPGLVFGGGLNYMHGEKGLVCMNVTEYEIRPSSVHSPNELLR
jgi:hypothetical protein